MIDPDDSDSSLSDAGSDSSTNVLLGYASKEPTDDPFSQLGGAPSWISPSKHPSPEMVQCKSCSSYMTLLLQLNGDLPDTFPGHERRLYIWACNRKACRRKHGTVRGFRGVRISKAVVEVQQQQVQPAEMKKQEEQDIGATLFGAKPLTETPSNPFFSKTSASSISTQNPFASATAPASSLASKPPQNAVSSDDPTIELPATFAQKARISSTIPSPQPQPTEPWPSPSSFPVPYPAYYLDAEYEYLSTSSTEPDQNNNLPSTAQSAFDELGSSATGDKEGDADSAQDRAFQHFSSRVAQNPEQVLRYEYNGEPLLYSRADEVGKLLSPASAAAGGGGVTTAAGTRSRMPRCGACGAERVFELQLMPHAIAELEAEGDDEKAPEAKKDVAVLLGEGMEWGTIIFGVCSRDCGSAVQDGQTVEYREEWVGVQWEEQVVPSRPAVASDTVEGGRAKGKGKVK